MDAVIRFIRQFIEAEYQVLITTYTQDDDLIVAQKQGELRKHFFSPHRPPMSLSFGRVPGKSHEQMLEEYAEYVKTLVPRDLFQVKHYRHPDLGDLYACYLGHYQKMELKSYGILLFVATIDEQLKIIARYGMGFSAETGTVTWEHRTGARINNPGKLIEVRKFIAPQKLDHLADFNSE